VGGKKYPLSPAIKAINDVKLLHKSEDTRLTLAQMAAKTPVAMPESMRSASEIFGKDKYIRPGAILYYDKSAGEQVPAGVNLGGNYPITLDITKQQADNIKDWFYVDFFLMLLMGRGLGNKPSGELSPIAKSLLDAGLAGKPEIVRAFIELGRATSEGAAAGGRAGAGRPESVLQGRGFDYKE
jgi:hypothetical protein